MPLDSDSGVDDREFWFSASYLQRAIDEAATTKTPRRWLARYGGLVMRSCNAPPELKTQFQAARQQMISRAPPPVPSADWR